ncbi:unnamed protein product [Rotaria magnacalcarata]|uniref:VCBS repeat-containing protein n=2 Tax=Rotaria magnacalcarata TaxID=392030 RepID=A0A819H1M9_9BILA|nr:unnamed protein product [Rotaria magnacalcarata]
MLHCFFLFVEIVCQTPYGPPNRYLTGPFPTSITTDDFNNDGKLDLAVDNTISLLFSRGDGTFNSQATYPVGSLPISITAGDFNGDSKLDLAVVNYDDNNIGMLLGNGDGTFQNQQTYSAGVHPISITAGDFNSDSKLDLAVVNYHTVKKKRRIINPCP